MASVRTIVDTSTGWPSIDIGALRHLITIQAEGPSSPPIFNAGGPVIGWNDFTTAMAAIDTVRGLDVIRGGQTTSQLFLTVAMWFQPGIEPNMRVVTANGDTYVIQSIANALEMNLCLELNCIGIGVND